MFAYFSYNILLCCCSYRGFIKEINMKDFSGFEKFDTTVPAVIFVRKNNNTL